MATPMETFAAEAPDVAAAFDRLIDALVRTDGLDARTKQIAYIAIKAAQGDATAVASTFQWPKPQWWATRYAAVTKSVLEARNAKHTPATSSTRCSSAGASAASSAKAN